MPGPAPKPDHLRTISGSARKRLLAPSATTTGAFTEPPPAPDWLPNSFALIAWNELAPHMVARGSLNQGNYLLLATLCALHGKNVQQFTSGGTPQAAMQAQITRAFSDLGLTGPHALVQLPSPSGRTNRFAHNGVRPNGARGDGSMPDDSNA